jgi:putative endopeptidase
MDKPGGFAFKCKCCANPWQITGASQGSSDFSFCEPCVAKGENKGLDPANIDMTVKPQDDFYLYSNGGWKNNNPCPPQYPRWGVFNVLNEENQARLRSILEELEDAGKNAAAEGSAEESDFERDLLVKYHKAFMDEEGIEKAGIAPVVEGMKTIQSMTAETFTEVIATLWTFYGHNSFFNFGSMPSMDDSSHTLLSFGQGGLGLPDRDYYFEAVHEDKREKYIMYLENLFKLLGEKGCTEGEDGLNVGAPYNSAKKYRDAARAVFEFEKLLAAGHMTKIEARDPVKSWNKMDWATLEKTLRPTADDWPSYLTKGVVPPQGSFFNLREFFARIGYEASTLGDVNIRHIEAMRKAVKLASVANLATIKHYLTARHVASAMPYMSEDFFSVHFNYFSKEMGGVKEVKDRWKRALDAQMSHLPDCMGKLYVKRYFDEGSKQKALAIVADVKEALRERLMEVCSSSSSSLLLSSSLLPSSPLSSSHLTLHHHPLIHAGRLDGRRDQKRSDQENERFQLQDRLSRRGRLD